MVENREAEKLIEALRETIKAMRDAHESMVTQCCSNPIKNAWDKLVDVSKINELQSVAYRAEDTITAFLRNHR